MMLCPRVTYYVQGHPILASLEGLIPGVDVQGRLGGRLYGLRRIDRARWAEVHTWELTVAWHSAWLLERVLAEVGLPALGAQPSTDLAIYAPYLNVFPETHRDWLLEYGRAVAQAAVARGELAQRFLDVATPYQVRAAGLGPLRPAGFLIWPTGRGKTAGALATITSRPGDVLVVCPAAARKEWRTTARAADDPPRTSVEKYSNLETHVVLPVSDRRKGYEPLEGYLHRMRSQGRRAVVVVGMETMGEYLDELRAFGPRILVIDEIHKLGDHKRFDCYTDTDGNKRFERAKTEGGEAMRRSLAAMEVSRLKTLDYRLGLSATPLDDGRPRRYWAPLDLLVPGSFGPYGNLRPAPGEALYGYAWRYCAPQISAQGYPDDRGCSHIDELKARCSFFVYNVSYAEASAAMTARVRLEVEYLEPGQLNRPDAMVKELRALAKGATGPASGPQARARYREAELARSCSCKRAAIVARAREFLANGQKVMILMSRRAMVEAWGALLERETGVPGFIAHGGLGPVECDRAVDAYADTKGAAWLIGTWDSIGESKNGMQGTHLGVVAQLPVKPATWIQGIGRWDRMDGVGTIVWVPLAEGMADDREVAKLTRKFGPIEKLIDAPELASMAEALDGTDDEELVSSMVAKLFKRDAHDAEEEE